MSTTDGYAERHLRETAEILARLDVGAIEATASILADVRDTGGRLFLVGSGGGAGHASHAACDFRKLAGLEAYCPTDNVSELTARINDEGWADSYAGWLRTSRLNRADALLVFSVGGGDAERGVSTNLVACMDLARAAGARIVGVVGRDGGYTARIADACVVVPTATAELITAHTEAIQAVVWHLLVSHPALKSAQTRWEELT